MMPSPTPLRLIATLLALSLTGCGAAGDDAGAQASTPSSSPSSSPPSSGSQSPSAGSAAPVASAPPPSAPCRPRDSGLDDHLESLTKTVQQTIGHGVAVEYSGLTESNSPLRRLLPTLFETGHVTAIAPTFTNGPHGPVFGALLEKPERRADGAASTSLHFGLAAAPCPGGEHAWLGPLIPLAQERSGAIAIIDSIWLPDQPPVTGLRIVIDKPPVDPLRRSGVTGEFSELLIGQGRPSMPVLEPEGAAIGVLGRIPRLAGPLPPAAGGAPAEPQEDVLLFGTGWYPLGRGAAMLVYHRQGPPPPRRASDKKSEPPAFFPPSFRLAARIDERGFRSDPARVGAAYFIAITTNQPPEGVCQKPLSEGPGFLCRGADTMVKTYIDGAQVSWLVGLFPDPVTAQKTMTSLKIKGKVYATEPPPGASPAQLDGKPVPWVLEGRPPKPPPAGRDPLGF